jgi:GMP synthase (glutamine-hydrolysing)
MDEILLLVNFNCPYIHHISLNLRRFGIYTQIISYQDTLPFSNEIKGILFLGDPIPIPTIFNLDSLEIPLLAIESGAWSLASSFNINLANENNKDNKDNKDNEDNDNNDDNDNISQNWIVSHYHSHPLLIGVESGSIIKNKRIKNLVGKNLISLCRNQNGITTIFQIVGKLIYGLQYCPEMDSPIWRNFLHLCRFNYTWQIPNILSTIKIQLKELINGTGIGKETSKESETDILIPYSGGVKSTILAVLLSNILSSKNISLKLINTGFFRLNEIENCLQTMNGLGIKIILDEVLCLSNPNIIHSTITDAFPNNLLIVPTLLNETNLPWKNTIIQPFRHLYRDELLSIGSLLGLSSKLLKRHPFPPMGLAEKLKGSISSQDLEFLKQMEFLWTNYLIKHNYYYQIYRSSVFLITNNIIGLLAIDDSEKTIPLPIEFLIEYNKYIKDVEKIDVELVYYLS